MFIKPASIYKFVEVGDGPCCFFIRKELLSGISLNEYDE